MTTADEIRNTPVGDIRTRLVGEPGVDAELMVNWTEHHRQVNQAFQTLALAVKAAGGEIRIPRSLAVSNSGLTIQDEWLTDEWVLRVKEPQP